MCVLMGGGRTKGNTWIKRQIQDNERNGERGEEGVEEGSKGVERT